MSSNVAAVAATPTSAGRKISWDIAILYFGLYLSCFAVIWTGFSWKGVAICVGSFIPRMVGLGIGYHRYFSHRAFKTSRAMQFALAVLGALTIQRGALWWAQTHRHHHRHTDTPEDLHSPRHHGMLYSHWGWFLTEKSRATDYSKVADFAKYRELVLLDHWALYNVPILLYAYGIYHFFGAEGLLWGISISTVLLWNISHWIQSVSHKWGGYRRCPSDDDSRNHWLLGVVSLGEWHNNHHYSPGSARQGFVWWEIDVNWYILKALSWLGLVWELRLPSDRILQGEFPAKGSVATASAGEGDLAA